jgi:hypothetical protein
MTKMIRVEQKLEILRRAEPASQDAGVASPASERRRFLTLGLASAAASLSGCNWLEEYFSSKSSADPTASAPNPAAPAPSPTPAPGAVTPAPAPAPNPAVAWAPNPTFVQGSTVPFDLATTLPVEVKRGGIFSIDPSGASLPTGATLTANGLLYAGTAIVGTTTGVVFRYSEPA